MINDELNSRSVRRHSWSEPITNLDCSLTKIDLYWQFPQLADFRIGILKRNKHLQPIDTLGGAFFWVKTCNDMLDFSVNSSTFLNEFS